MYDSVVVGKLLRIESKHFVTVMFSKSSFLKMLVVRVSLHFKIENRKLKFFYYWLMIHIKYKIAEYQTCEFVNNASCVDKISYSHKT